MTARTHRQFATALSIAALLSFVGYHLFPLAIVYPAPGSSGPPPVANAWVLWQEIGYFLTKPRELLEDPLVLGFTLGLVFVTLVFGFAPISVGLLSKSRVFWWLTLLSCCLSSISIVYELIVAYSDFVNLLNAEVKLGPGAFFLFLALQLQLVALFFIRGEKPPLLSDPSAGSA